MDGQSTVPHRVSGIPITSLLLEVVQGPDAGKKLAATEDTITVGTAPGNNLLLSDETVSRYHLELTRKGDRIQVVDHGSTNGTRLGNAYLERATISPGSVLSIGRTSIKVVDGDTVTVQLYEDEQLGVIRGRTPEMRALMAKIEAAARTEASVLLIGETGTGKDLIARAIHDASPRAERGFETVDCAAMLPALLASELFGHEKGAFPGADEQHVGLFERASGGTIFLDEVGEIPVALQTALAAALERKEFRRVGGQKKIACDVRIVSATARDLRTEVNAGTFRQDFYYRIAVLVMSIPALRDHAGDIPILVEHFLREAGHEGPVEEIIAESTMQALKTHRWPGNVRELRNFVESALAMGETPRLDETLERVRSGTGVLRASAVPDIVRLSYKDARAAVLKEFETIYIKDLLDRTKHNVSAASREAKMNRSYLIEMIKRLGIR
jgi:DNA-binding NtrC family response regulator